MKPYYDHAGITIYHGDCRELLSRLDTVHHIITDPPYSEYVHSKQRRGANEWDYDGDRWKASISRARDLGFDAIDRETMDICSREFARLATRWVLVFSDVESCHRWRQSLEHHGLDYVRTGVWVKENAAPAFTGDRPASAFEVITICHQRGRKRWNGGGKHALWTVPIVLNRSHRDPRLHTTQKPLRLMRELIALFTDPGDIIVDPFMGSGTTLRAAKDLGRRAIGIEREERYCEVAAQRMAQEVLALT